VPSPRPSEFPSLENPNQPVPADSIRPERRSGASSLLRTKREEAAEAAGTPPLYEIKEHVDQVCDRFEKAWQAAGLTGTPPPLREYLRDIPAYEYPYLLRELVKLDVFYRSERKESPRPDEYRPLMPTSIPPWPAEVFDDPIPAASLSTRLDEPGGPLPPTPADGPTGPDNHGFPAIAGHEILEELGHGGMGVVYKAVQKGLNRIVALKVSRNAHHAGAEERTRFRAEAEAVARLHHANIVQIYEIGEHQGLPFFSLEFCPGGSLAETLERSDSTLSGAEAAGLIETLARALHVAHVGQVIHRDLKPANILFDGNGIPRITDFGLAKRLDVAHQTQNGAVLGTPCYMAPEQARGEVGRIGPATDVFALSAILYEVLTGRPPFKGDNAIDTLLQVRNDDPVPPRRLQPKVPLDLQTICLKGLQKDPARRYATAEEMADDLRRFLNREPIRARQISSLTRAIKWARRNPWIAGATAACLAAVTAGVGFLVVALLYTRTAADLAEAKTRNLERENTELIRQREIDDSIRDRWDRGKEAEVAGDLARDHKEVVTAAEHYRKAATHYDQLLLLLRDRPGHELLPQVGLRRAQVEQSLREQTTRAEWHRLAERFIKAGYTIGVSSLNLAGRNPDAQRRQIRARTTRALAELRLTVPGPPEDAVQALQRLRDRLDPEPFQRVAVGCYEMLLILADAEAGFSSTEDSRECIARAQQALKVLEVASAVGTEAGVGPTQTFHLRRARYYTHAGDDGEARLDRARAAGLPPRTALDHFLLAVDAYGQGEWERVASSCREVLRQQPTHFWAHYLRASVRLREHHASEAEAELLACLGSGVEIPWPHLALASAHLELGDLAAAEKDFTEALLRASDPVEQYPILTNRSLLWLRLGPEHWDKARADLLKAIALQPEAHQAYMNLAELHRRGKEWPEALAALDRAEQRHPGTPGIAHTRARLLVESGNPAAARRAFRQTIDREPKGSKSIGVLSALVELGYLKLQDREYEQALADFDRALAIDPTYLLAHRQKANALISLKRDREAGKVLDQYLALARDRTDDLKFEAYQMRGLIHAQLRENAEAIEALTRALLLNDDCDTRNRRGWVFLAVNSPSQALADFDRVLGRQARHADALCGRAHALVQLKEPEQAVKDAEQSLKEGKPTPRLLLGAARIHGWVAGGGFGRATATPIQRHVNRVTELLEDALRRQAPAERVSFFAQQIRKEPAFASLWRDPRMQQLARSFER
jgi:tetratricopeptide (TPR) repeat protein